MKIHRLLFLSSLLALLGFIWPIAYLFSSPTSISSEQEQLPQLPVVSKSVSRPLPKEQRAVTQTGSWLQNQMRAIKARTANIDEKVLRLSLIAYQNAMKKGLPGKQVLTVIDYSKPSSEKRLWVFDLKNGKTLFNTWVSHGKNSGGAKATSFSNNHGSLKSSLGVFLTEDPYIGGNGYSLRLLGLERGVNDNAYDRNVVVHGARYVNADMIRSNGQVGRSWGCPAVSKNLSTPLINTIKDRTLVFVYYPDRNWLSHSPFLAG